MNAAQQLPEMKAFFEKWYPSFAKIADHPRIQRMVESGDEQGLISLLYQGAWGRIKHKLHSNERIQFKREFDQMLDALFPGRSRERAQEVEKYPIMAKKILKLAIYLNNKGQKKEARILRKIAQLTEDEDEDRYRDYEFETPASEYEKLKRNEEVEQLLMPETPESLAAQERDYLESEHGQIQMAVIRHFWEKWMKARVQGHPTLKDWEEFLNTPLRQHISSKVSLESVEQFPSINHLWETHLQTFVIYQDVADEMAGRTPMTKEQHWEHFMDVPLRDQIGTFGLDVVKSEYFPESLSVEKEVPSTEDLEEWFGIEREGSRAQEVEKYPIMAKLKKKAQMASATDLFKKIFEDYKQRNLEKWYDLVDHPKDDKKWRAFTDDLWDEATEKINNAAMRSVEFEEFTEDGGYETISDFLDDMTDIVLKMAANSPNKLERTLEDLGEDFRKSMEGSISRNKRLRRGKSRFSLYRNKDRVARTDRIHIAKRLFAQHQTACLWCPELRPNEQPNMIKVGMEGSHGICEECKDVMLKDLPR